MKENGTFLTGVNQVECSCLIKKVIMEIHVTSEAGESVFSERVFPNGK